VADAPATDARARLAQAKARLDTLAWYPQPVRTERVRVLHAPWFFRLPYLRRFAGYASWNLVLLRRPLAECSDDLLVHELCHVWQMQHRPLRMPLSYLLAYERNPYERQARRADALTRPTRAAAPAGPSRAA
jgi:hypothetical protein